MGKVSEFGIYWLFLIRSRAENQILHPMGYTYSSSNTLGLKRLEEQLYHSILVWPGLVFKIPVKCTGFEVDCKAERDRGKNEGVRA